MFMMRKSRRPVVCLLIIIAIPALTLGEGYLWPTDASPYLTSSFGEYRARHFHAGIDIKTWSRSGYKALAIDDGYIWRIRTSDTGYGKALYLKTASGDIAVYAHLDRFSESIADYVYQLQTRRSEYALDHFPPRDKFPVERGEVIAYTGNTGTRYPHLHFEIRNGKNQPENPLSKGLSIKDNIPPVPDAVAVTPLSRQSNVDGAFNSKIFQVRRLENNMYTTQPVNVTGKFGLEIKAYDSVEDVYNQYSIYSARIFHDDSLLFSMQYDRFSYSETGLILFERNYGLRRTGHGYFQRLYKTNYTNDLPFYRDDLSGSIHLPAGRDTLNLILRDYNGNESIVHIPVNSTPDHQYQVQWRRINDRIVRCAISPFDSIEISDLRFYSVESFRTRTPLDPHSLTFHGDTAFISLIHTGDKTPLMLQIENNHRVNNRSFFFGEENLPEIPEITWEFTPRGMVGSFTSDGPLYADLNLEIISPEQDTIIPFRTRNFSHWQTPPVNVEIIGKTAVFLSNGNRVRDMPLYHHTAGHPARSSSLGTPDGKVKLRIPSGSLYYPGLIWTERGKSDAGISGTPTWSFYPRTLPFRDPATITFEVPEVDFPKRQMGIYYSSNGDDWRYLPGEFNADSSGITGEILSLESFTIQRDAENPILRARYPKPGSIVQYNSRDKFVWHLDDEKTGIPGRESIQLLIDQTPVIFEFNPITGVLTYRLREPLTRGSHSVQFSATDAAGNRTELSYSFTVQ